MTAKTLNSPRFQRQIERICAMGARPVAELIIEAAGSETRAAAIVERYAGIDIDVLEALGGRRFPPRPGFRVVPGDPS